MSANTKIVNLQNQISDILNTSSSITEGMFFATSKNVDNAYCALFNAICRSTCPSSSPIKFEIPMNKRNESDVGRARRIVSSWSPTVFDASADPTSFLQTHILSQFFKRFLSSEESEPEAIRSLQAKANLDFIALCSEGDHFDDYALSNPDVKVLLDMMGDIVDDCLGDFNIPEVYAQCKHGPNSTNDLPLLYSYEHIKGEQVVGTRHSLQQFWHYLQWDSNLREVLVESNDRNRAFINALIIDPIMVVDCVDQLFVPKSFDKLRGMQPFLTVPAFLGQGVGGVITDRLMKVGIDLRTQPDVHCNLARLGSLYPEMETATIDWSGASDRIWTCLVKRVFSGNSTPWYDFMNNCCRCDLVRLNFKVLDGVSLPEPFTGCDGTVPQILESIGKHCSENNIECYIDGVNVTCLIHGPMFATMGNPITFPLETLLFYAFLTACGKIARERLARDPYIRPDSIDDFYVSCFGDDGIINVKSMPEVIKYASLIGWKLNLDKSFTTGAFRESCGGDYYMGLGCRPLMLERPPISFKLTEKENKLIIQSWLYVAANAANAIIEQLGYDTSFIDQWLVNYHKLFKLGKICVVPPHSPDGSGLRCMFFNYGWIGPQDIDMTTCLDSDSFHIPTFEVVPDSPVLRSIVFRCIESVPRVWNPSVSNFDPDTKRIKVYPTGSSWYYWAPFNWEVHYYIRALRAPVNDIVFQKSLFTTTLKTRAVLKPGGLLPIKECRLQKLYSSTISWY